MTITAAQIRAARQLVRVSQADIAEATGLSVPTIKRAESERDVAISSESISAIRKALEKAGVIFVESNGEGPGVRLKKVKPE
ncbi:MAG: helix-turn-helix transcriptional regulator [Methylocystis sp.]|uniref:helix-turn-helix domain-containing protein n=1 Tax=Methylocystis sp. TaxID=1911079 RepID=UPI00392D9195